MGLYATDGKCHNAEPGTFNHECGKRATWVGINAAGFACGYCDECKKHGSEARDVIDWHSLDFSEQAFRAGVLP